MQKPELPNALLCSRDSCVLLIPEPPLHPPADSWAKVVSPAPELQMCMGVSRGPHGALLTGLPWSQCWSLTHAPGAVLGFFCRISPGRLPLCGGWSGPLSYAWHVCDHRDSYGVTWCWLFWFLCFVCYCFLIMLRSDRDVVMQKK